MTHLSQEERMRMNRNRIAKLRLKRSRHMQHIFGYIDEYQALKLANVTGWNLDRVLVRIQLQQEFVRALNKQVDKLEAIRYRRVRPDVQTQLPQPQQHEAVAA
jgi:hypothetical protein